MLQASSPPDLSVIKTGFQALSDDLRLSILDLLRSQELCVCDLCEKLEVRQSKLSFHLKILKEAKLVRSRQQGRWVYYSLNLTQFLQLEEYLATYRTLTSLVPSRICEE